jgi:DNA repair protein RadA/Sms
MAKQTIQYICSSCGAKAPQLLGRCPVCGEWGTYEEEVVATASSKHALSVSLGGHTKAQRLHEVTATEEMRTAA